MTKENRAFLNSIPAKRGAFAHELSIHTKPLHTTPLRSCVAWVRTLPLRSCQRQQAFTALDSGEPHVSWTVAVQ